MISLFLYMNINFFQFRIPYLHLTNTTIKKGVKVFQIVLLHALFLLQHIASAQSLLPVDDSTKKVTFEEIVKVDSTSLMTLQSNAEAWIQKNLKSDNSEIRLDSNGGRLSSEGKFFVYTKGIASKEIHGAIRFKLTIETKPNKYRYRFSDFVFEYYKQNRQFKYVPTGKEKPLEDPKFPGWEKPWVRYKKETAGKINTYISSLKEAMIYKKELAEKKPVVKKEEW